MWGRPLPARAQQLYLPVALCPARRSSLPIPRSSVPFARGAAPLVTARGTFHENAGSYRGSSYPRERQEMSLVQWSADAQL